MEQDRDDPAADMEMTTNEAAAYLSGPVSFTLSAKLVRDLRYLDRGPVVEKRGCRLVYRESALDAFLTVRHHPQHVDPGFLAGGC